MSSQPTETTETRNESAIEGSAESASSAASIPENTSTDGSEGSASASAEGHDDAGDDGHDADDGGEGVEGEAGEEGASADGTPGDGTKKKRRRRRKKKGAAEVQLGPDGQPLPPPEPRVERPRRDQNALPFSRYFPDTGGRRHILSPGEVVAGRVVSVERGVAVLDLFGRGVAFATETEPREIPEPPAEPHTEEDHGATAASDPSQVADAMAKLDGQVGMPASESLPPPPPVDLDGDGIPDIKPNSEHPADAHASDPVAMAEAARGLLQVGTPQLDEQDDGGDEHHDETASSAGTEEAPAVEEIEGPRIEVGSVFRGRIGAVSENGSVAIYNRVFVRAESRARLTSARQEHRRVFGLVYGYNRGGFDVLVEGMRAFCPISGLTLEHIDDPEPLIGQRLEFSVQQAKSGHQGIVVSRRGILEREARKRSREMRKSLKVGQVLKGRVAQVRDFGLIVDLGGIEGLVHMSEVSWDRSLRPADAAKVGDEVDVQIVRLGAPEYGPRGGRDNNRDNRAEGGGGRDRRRDGRIGLSMKACQPDPFESELAGVVEGTIKKGKVMRVAEFGAFVEIAPGVEGLLHVSELGKDLKHAGERIKEGEDVVVCIDRIDIKARRVALSKLSDADAKLWAEGTLPETAGKSVKIGSNIKVRVEKIEPFGLLVQVEGVPGKKGRGVIPSSETGTERGTDLRKKFPPGVELEVKVVGLDRDGSLRCSLKALKNDEERKAIQDYRREAATKGFGTFGDLLKRKIKG
jgi:small subunit ribosomal protein S1